MRCPVIAAALAGLLALPGCVDKGAVASASAAAPVVKSSLVSKVQSYVGAGCGFAPEAKFVAGVVARADPSLAAGADMATYLAKLVCQEAKTSFASLRAFGHGEVLGVPIVGAFLPPPRL